MDEAPLGVHLWAVRTSYWPQRPFVVEDYWLKQPGVWHSNVKLDLSCPGFDLLCLVEVRLVKL